MRTVLSFFILFHVIAWSTSQYTQLNQQCLQTICCECRTFNLPCAFCTYGVSHGCDLTGTRLTNWAASVNSFGSSHLRSATTQRVLASRYFVHDMACAVSSNSNNMCTSTTLSFHQSGSFIYQNEPVCHSTSCSLPSSCSPPIHSSTSPQFCYSAFRSNSLRTSVSGNELCLDGIRVTGSSSLVNILRNMQDPVDVSAHSNSTTLWLTTSNTNWISAFSSSQHYRTISTHNVINTQDPAITAVVSDSWWGRVFVRNRGPCKLYMPFSSTEDVCVDDFVSGQQVIGGTDSVRAAQDRSAEIDVVISHSEEESCEELLDRTRCISDYIIENSRGGGFSDNPHSQDYLNQLHEDAMTRQDSWWSKLTSWFSPGAKILWSLFGDELKDFVVWLIPVMLEQIYYFAREIIDVIYRMFMAAQPYIQHLIDLLTEILEILFTLLELVLKAVMGLILQLESRFLIFEYIVLFVYLNRSFVNNNIACTLIVLLVCCVFGIERRSPSILLTFYNSQFYYVNLTSYFDQSFNWDYRFFIRTHPGNNTLSLGFASTPASLFNISEVQIYKSVNKTKKFDFNDYPIY